MRWLVAAAVLAAALPHTEARSFMVQNDAFMKDGQPYTILSGSFHYHRAHPDQWIDRMQRLQAMGLNTIQVSRSNLSPLTTSPRESASYRHIGPNRCPSPARLQTYVPWNFHEVAPGQYDFSGPRNITRFLASAQSLGLNVLLRAGPYICGEHDFGGFPALSLNVPGIVYRTNNTQYLDLVTAWWNTLLPVVAPYTYANGGPIIMVQPENEFGSYGNTGGNPADKAYLEYLKNLVYSHLGGPSQIQLYTTDGGDVGYLKGGTLPGEILATGDGGGDPYAFMAAEDQFNPPGMRAHTNSEYYTGWLTHWGESMANTSSVGTAGGLSAFLAAGSSINLYMGEFVAGIMIVIFAVSAVCLFLTPVLPPPPAGYGGTNFGFWNGANGGGSSFQPVITSYDYDSPVSEGGIHGYGPDGDKYRALQQVYAYWSKSTPPPEPPAPAVTAYGTVQMTQTASLWSNLAVLAPTAQMGVQYVGTAESFNQTRGYTLYRTTLPAGITGAATVTVTEVRDRVELFVNGGSVGATWRPSAGPLSIPANQVVAGAQLDFLSESMSHINYGHGIFDPKGITQSVVINSVNVTGNWSVYPMEMHEWQLGNLSWGARGSSTTGPAFYQGTFTITGAPTDTYITFCGWNKGTFWINAGVPGIINSHLGRYWETQGPQHAFYVPAPVLVSGVNTITIFEQHATNADATVAFVAAPDFTGAVCNNGVPMHVTKKEEEKPVAVAVDAARTLKRAAPAPELAACAAPAVGLNITLQSCSIGAAATTWTFNTVNKIANAGSISLAAAPTLCIGQYGKNPDTGYPNLALVPCNATDNSQDFIYFQDLPAMSFMNVVSGNCFDCTSGSVAPGTRIELYGCTGNTNQGWSIPKNPGQITNVASSSVCLAAC